jgi:hypothetical protein
MFQWADLQPVLYPIKDFEDLSRRWREGFSYPCVRSSYNFTMPEMETYAARQLGEDTLNRYVDFATEMRAGFRQLHEAGARNVLDLVESIQTREAFEGFIAEKQISPSVLISNLKYMVLWFIPMKKGLGELHRGDPRLAKAISQLRGIGIRYNLDLLERGLTLTERLSLADQCNAPLEDINEMVNRADFSRMAWASKATISNFFGAGYQSLAQFAAADLDQVCENFFRYGQSIGKDLRLGNDIVNSHRAAQLLPKVLVE